MSVHPDGSGTGWTNVEAVDIDQPHGKDYLYSQHIAKGVRKRVNKEHEAFGDTTAGGEHLAGGCRILGITDATADITTGAGDASIDLTVGKFIGRGLIYDQTTNSLWCYTGDGTVTDDPYELIFGARCISKGDDFTWTGEHQFDASVYLNNPVEASTVDITGVLTVDSSTDCSDIYANGDISISGTLKVATDFTLTGDMAVDGTSNFYDEIDFSDAAFDGTFTFNAGAVFNHFGDWSTRAIDVTYTAATDGIVTGYAVRAATILTLAGHTPYGSNKVLLTTGSGGTGTLCWPVKKGATWAFKTDPTTATSSGVFWLPFGDNT